MYGDFRSTELATPSSAASSCSPDSVMLSAGSAPITASHVRAVPRPPDLGCVGADQVREIGVELRPAALAVHRHRGVVAPDAIRYLHILGQLCEPRRQRY